MLIAYDEDIAVLEAFAARQYFRFDLYLTSFEEIVPV